MTRSPQLELARIPLRSSTSGKLSKAGTLVSDWKPREVGKALPGMADMEGESTSNRVLTGPDSG